MHHICHHVPENEWQIHLIRPHPEGVKDVKVLTNINYHSE